VSQDAVKAAFVNALGISPDSAFEQLAYGQQKEWDSVGHLALVAELEDQFDIMLSTEDVIGMSSYNVTLDILRSHGVVV
jgi:acyl carrier protein